MRLCLIVVVISLVAFDFGFGAQLAINKETNPRLRQPSGQYHRRPVIHSQRQGSENDDNSEETPSHRLGEDFKQLGQDLLSLDSMHDPSHLVEDVVKISKHLMSINKNGSFRHLRDDLIHFGKDLFFIDGGNPAHILEDLRHITEDVASIRDAANTRAPEPVASINEEKEEEALEDHLNKDFVNLARDMFFIGSGHHPGHIFDDLRHITEDVAQIRKLVKESSKNNNNADEKNQTDSQVDLPDLLTSPEPSTIQSKETAQQDSFEVPATLVTAVPTNIDFSDSTAAELDTNGTPNILVSPPTNVPDAPFEEPLPESTVPESDSIALSSPAAPVADVVDFLEPITSVPSDTEDLLLGANPGILDSELNDNGNSANPTSDINSSNSFTDANENEYLIENSPKPEILPTTEEKTLSSADNFDFNPAENPTETILMQTESGPNESILTSGDNLSDGAPSLDEISQNTATNNPADERLQEGPGVDIADDLGQQTQPLISNVNNASPAEIEDDQIQSETEIPNLTLTEYSMLDSENTPADFPPTPVESTETLPVESTPVEYQNSGDESLPDLSPSDLENSEISLVDPIPLSFLPPSQSDDFGQVSEIMPEETEPLYSEELDSVPLHVSLSEQQETTQPFSTLPENNFAENSPILAPLASESVFDVLPPEQLSGYTITDEEALLRELDNPTTLPLTFESPQYTPDDIAFETPSRSQKRETDLDASQESSLTNKLHFTEDENETTQLPSELQDELDESSFVEESKHIPEKNVTKNKESTSSKPISQKPTKEENLLNDDEFNNLLSIATASLSPANFNLDLKFSKARQRFLEIQLNKAVNEINVLRSNFTNLLSLASRTKLPLYLPTINRLGTLWQTAVTSVERALMFAKLPKDIISSTQILSSDENTKIYLNQKISFFQLGRARGEMSAATEKIELFFPHIASDSIASALDKYGLQKLKPLPFSLHGKCEKIDVIKMNSKRFDDKSLSLVEDRLKIMLE